MNQLILAYWVHKRAASEQIQRVNVVWRCNLHGQNPISSERFYNCVPFMILGQQLEELCSIPPLFQY